MTWAGVAVGVVGGVISADSARQAGNSQAAAAKQASDSTLAATRETNALTANMYKNGVLQQAPYQRGGQLALSALMGGFGLGPAHNPSDVPVAPSGNVPAAGSTTGTGATSAGTFVNAQGQAVDAQGNPISSSDPYGIANLNYGATNADLTGASKTLAPDYFTHSFNAEDLKAGIDPGYQFRIDQGNSGLNARRAATGNRLGGQALKDIAGFNQDLASTEYGNAFARYNANRSDIFNRLSSLAGTGQTAGQSAATLGAGAAGQIGSNTMSGVNSSNNLLTSGAASAAAGQVGSTNALVGGLNTAYNNYTLGSYLNGKKSNITTPGLSGRWNPVTGQFDA